MPACVVAVPAWVVAVPAALVASLAVELACPAQVFICVCMVGKAPRKASARVSKFSGSARLGGVGRTVMLWVMGMAAT